MRGPLVTVVVSFLVGCPPPPPLPPVPDHDALLEAEPNLLFRDLRLEVTQLTTNQFPGVKISLVAKGTETVTERVELYGRHGNLPIEQLVVVRLSVEAALVGDAHVNDADALGEVARQRASTSSDLALLRVDDAVPLQRVIETARLLRAHGFERVTLSATNPARIQTHATGGKSEWLRVLEMCPLAEGAPDDAVVTMQLQTNGQGGIGSIKILSTNHPGSSYAGAMCVAAEPYPPETPTNAPYRLRMRFAPPSR